VYPDIRQTAVALLPCLSHVRVRARVREKVGRRVGEGLQREREESGGGDAGIWRQTGRVSLTLCVLSSQVVEHDSRGTGGR
jgi:hypothetical protein